MSLEKLDNGDFIYPQLFDKFNNLVDQVSGLTINSGTTINGDYLPLSSFTSYSANTLNLINEVSATTQNQLNVKLNISDFNSYSSDTLTSINKKINGSYLTTNQRVIFGQTLSGFSEYFVFDIDLQILFAWSVNQWIPIGSINQQNPNLNFPNIPTTPSNYPNFNISATTDNLTTPIIYTTSDNTIATIDSNGVVTLTGKIGVVTIVASQASGNGYEGSQVSKSFNIVEPSFTNIVTDVGSSPTTIHLTASTRSNYFSLYIPEHSSIAEKHGLINPRFNIYVKINSTTHTVEVDFISKYIFKINSGDIVSIGADIARNLTITQGFSNNIENTTLRTVTGTNLIQETDIASIGTISMPFFNLPSKHITLPNKERVIRFNSNGNEKYWVLYKEFDGSNWSPTQKITVPKSGNITLETSSREICFATTNGANININVPSTTVVDRNTSVERRYTVPTVTGTQYQVSNVAELTAACAAAVAGDEILLLYAGSPYTGVTINTSAFTANIAAGRKGAEGIIIRGQIVGGNKPVIKPTTLTGETTGAIAISNANASLFTYVKDLQLDSTAGGRFSWVGGKWMINIDRMVWRVTMTADDFDIAFGIKRGLKNNCLE
jgi:hypothetical protein